MMVNMREICRVGEGRLHHDENGFRLTGCGGKLDYFQKPEASYSLYADYFWYEIGDMLCIGGASAVTGQERFFPLFVRIHDHLGSGRNVPHQPLVR